MDISRIKELTGRQETFFEVNIAEYVVMGNV